MEGGSRIAMIAIPSPGRHGSYIRVFQKMTNKLWREYQNKNVNRISWSLRKINILHIAVLSSLSFAQNTFFWWRLFSFKELSKIFKDCWGKFKDFLKISYKIISNFQGLFKDMMLFQGIFKAHVNHDPVCHWAIIASLINCFFFMSHT